MTSYVESVLAPGEKIVYRARISRWKFLLYYLVGILALAGGPAALIITGDRSQTGFILAGITMLAGLLILLVAAIRRNTTELVLTNRRIITKRGLISRDTVEMNLSKVESLHVNQSLMGRLLDYGDVSVVGTGASLEPLRGIGRPLELRKRLGEIAEVGVPKAVTERS
jgi:LPXTG-motif cell wall-anchored protein